MNRYRVGSIPPPEVDWSTYERCDVCDADPGEHCRSMKRLRSPMPVGVERPHPRRRRASR